MVTELHQLLSQELNQKIKLSPVSGGLSNQNYCLLLADNSRFFVREFGEQYQLFGNQADREAKAQRIAATAGIAPEVYSQLTTYMRTAWVEGHHWSPKAQAESANIKRLASLVAKLHAINPPENIIDIPSQFQHYFIQIESGYKTPLFIKQYERVLEISHQDLAVDRMGFCHHDINPLNIIESNTGQLLLLDWEFAAYGHCDFDLATLFQTFNWSHQQQADFLSYYNAEIDTAPVTLSQLSPMLLVVNLMTLLWAIIMYQSEPIAQYLALWQSTAKQLADKLAVYDDMSMSNAD